jgi:hypothetical protein
MESDITVVADNFGVILIIFSMRLVSDQSMIGSESTAFAASERRGAGSGFEAAGSYPPECGVDHRYPLCVR